MAVEVSVLRLKIDSNGVITGSREAGRGFDAVKNKSRQASATVDKGTTALDKFGKTAKYVRGILYGAAAYTLYRSLTKVVDAAAQHEQAIVKLNAVLKATGGAAGMSSQAIQSWATETQRATGISDEMLINAQSVMLTFTQISGDVMPAAMEAVLDTAKVFGGLDQATIQLGKALNDPIVGLTALRRIGLSFNEEQTEMIQGLAKSGRLMEAQQEILAEINREYGGVSRAMGDTFTATRNKTTQEFGDLLENIGKNLTQKGAPLYVGFTWLNEILQDINDNFETFSKVAGTAGKIGLMAIPGASSIAALSKAGKSDAMQSTLDWLTGKSQPGSKWINSSSRGKSGGGGATTGITLPEITIPSKAGDPFQDVLNWQKWDTYEQQLAEVTMGATALDIEMRNAFDSVGQLGDSFPRLQNAGTAAAQNLSNSFSNFFEENRNMVDDWSDGFTDAIMRVTRDGADAFGDFFDYVGQSMLRLYINKTVTQPLFSGIESWLSGRAAGGPVRAGQPYMVGERGPEIVVPGSSGSVIPNHAIGGSTVQIIDQRGANSAPLKVSKTQNSSGEIIRVVIEEVKGAMGSGEFDSVLGNSFGLARVGRG